MAYCFHCDRVRLRLRAIPEQPGRWGNFLASVVAACWAAMRISSCIRVSEGCCAIAWPAVIASTATVAAHITTSLSFVALMVILCKRD